MANGVYQAMTELQVINKLFKDNSTQFIVLNGITSDYFTTYKEHFNFIMEYSQKYNQMPSEETFQGKFNDNFEWINVTDPDDYLISKLSEAKLYRDMIGEYKALGELIKNEQTDKAIEKMAALSQQHLKSKKTEAVDLINDVKQRFDSYEERCSDPVGSFVLTGLTELDQITGGWDRKNESAVIAARTGVGKSWWLIYFALQAAKQGLRVGYYSGEMEVDLVGYRMDTFLGNIPNGALNHGNEYIKEKYTTYVESLNKVIPGHIFCITPDMFDGNVTVSKLRAFVEKYDLEMLCVDQFSLLNDEKGAKNPREQMINISKDLRTLQRLKKIPILSAVQLNREDTSESGGPSTRNISECDRIGQDSTIVLFVERKGDNYILTLGKSRGSRSGDKLTYYCDLNNGILHYIPSENDALKGSASKDVQQQYNDTQKSDSVF